MEQNGVKVGQKGDESNGAKWGKSVVKPTRACGCTRSVFTMTSPLMPEGVVTLEARQWHDR